MIETTIGIHGMACSMCEAHICDTLRNRFPVKKVSASHSKAQAVVLSAEPLDGETLRRAIAAIGYEVTSVSAKRTEEKKGLLGFLKK